MNRIALLFVGGLIVGCAPQPNTYRGTLHVASAKLVPVNPDVKAVADADKPVFFARGAYWLFHDGGWYSAPTLQGSFVKVERPPVPVIQIAQPYAYTHYARAENAQTAASEPLANPERDPEPSPDAQRARPMPGIEPNPLLQTPR